MEPKDTKKLQIQISIGVLVLLINLIFPAFMELIRYPVLGIVIFMIGMPHGAIDHIIAQNLYTFKSKNSYRAKFYSWYLGVMVLFTIGWVLSPLMCFAIFFLMTMYHFGQADAERFKFDGWKKALLHYSRGITVVGLIFFGDLSYSSPVIESVTQFSLEAFTTQFIDHEILAYALAAFYPLAFLISAVGSMDKKAFGYYLMDATVVPVFFLLCDPIIAFSLYFGVWHSYNHVEVMLNFLSKKGNEVNFGWFFKESFVFSLLSYIGILFLYNMMDAFGEEELLISLLFISISVLTLPHMYIVEDLYKKGFK